MSGSMGEQLSDPNDVASEVEMRTTESALNRVRQAARRQQEPDAQGRYAILDCVECGSEIGEGRLRVAIKNHLCIYCAELSERKRR